MRRLLPRAPCGGQNAPAPRPRGLERYKWLASLRRAVRLESSAFSDGGEIPRHHGYKNGNQRPPLSISGVPGGARSLAIVMDDPDAVAAVGKQWVHWTAWNIGAGTAEIAGGLPAGAVEGRTDFGEVGYGGPAPPDREHVYVFSLYALDAELDLEPGAARDSLESSMRGHIVATARLRGRYAP